MKKILMMTLNVCLLASTAAQAQGDLPFAIEPITAFDEPWALAFLPDGSMAALGSGETIRIAAGTYDLTRTLVIDGVDDVTLSVTEVDSKTETIRLLIGGQDINYDRVQDVFSRFGAAVRSIDEIVVQSE